MCHVGLAQFTSENLPRGPKKFIIPLDWCTVQWLECKMCGPSESIWTMMDEANSRNQVFDGCCMTEMCSLLFFNTHFLRTVFLIMYFVGIFSKNKLTSLYVNTTGLHNLNGYYQIKEICRRIKVLHCKGIIHSKLNYNTLIYLNNHYQVSLIHQSIYTV